MEHCTKLFDGKLKLQLKNPLHYEKVGSFSVIFRGEENNLMRTEKKIGKTSPNMLSRTKTIFTFRIQKVGKLAAATTERRPRVARWVRRETRTRATCLCQSLSAPRDAPCSRWRSIPERHFYSRCSQATCSQPTAARRYLIILVNLRLPKTMHALKREAKTERHSFIHRHRTPKHPLQFKRSRTLAKAEIKALFND